MKRREQLLRALRAELKQSRISADQSVLIIGGSTRDDQLLREVGFQNLTNSNLASDMARLNGDGTRHVALDAEQMDLPSDSYDIVFASEVLHHCSSPHRALCEMLRVSRRHVVFMEPNDSAAMNALVRMNFSFPYELAAVVDHNFKSGGVRDSHIPNFIYRWSQHEVVKTVSSYIPERKFSVRARPYWDFHITEEELAMRKTTRIGSLTSVMGAGNFIVLLHLAESCLNSVMPLRNQGNKFFCSIEKSSDLKPWMAREGNRVIFNREYGQA
jgi:ubiquinone/menaquinone biosynthesis C-methylase UbiE